MSANVQFQLIGKVIELQDFYTVMKLKITEDFFDDISKQVFKYISDHFHNQVTYGCVPSWQLINQYFPNFADVPSFDSLATLCDQVRLSRLRQQIISASLEMQAAADKDPRGAVELMRARSSQISSEHDISEEYYLSQAAGELQRDYDLIASGQGITGIPWPWNCLNDETQGIQSQDFVVLYSRPKNMKTWVALYIGTNAYLMHKCRVLVFSNEMAPKKILRRAAACIAKVDDDKMRKGKLTPGEYGRLFRALQHLEALENEDRSHGGHQPAFLVVGKPKGRGRSNGISSLQAKIQDFKPDLVIIDGIYLMDDDLSKGKVVDWKSISSISRGIKDTCNTLNVPIIGVTQANRQAKDTRDPDLVELAYADAIGQDCDLAIRVALKAEQGQDSEITMQFPGTREGKLDGFVINAVPCVNFNYKRDLVISQQAQQSGQASGGGGSGKGGSGGGGAAAKNAGRGVPQPAFSGYVGTKY